MNMGYIWNPRDSTCLNTVFPKSHLVGGEEVGRCQAPRFSEQPHVSWKSRHSMAAVGFWSQLVPTWESRLLKFQEFHESVVKHSHY